MQIGDAVVEEFARAEMSGEGARADLAGVVARVGRNNLNLRATRRALDEQPIGRLPLRLIVDAHRLIDGQAIVERVFAHKVPVAHPRRAHVADRAAVGEGPGGGKLFRHSVRERVGLRNRQQRRSRADGFENAVSQYADARRACCGGCSAGLGFQAGGVACALRGGGSRDHPRRNDCGVSLAGNKVNEIEATAEVKVIAQCARNSGDGDLSPAAAKHFGVVGLRNPDLLHLRGERRGRDRELEAVKADLGKRRRNEGFLHQIREDIRRLRRGRELAQRKPLARWRNRAEAQCARHWLRRVVQQEQIERRRPIQRHTHRPLLRHRPHRQQRSRNRRGVALEVAQVVDDAGVVLDRGGLPAGDGAEVQLVADARVLHVVLPGVVALLAQREPELLGRRKRRAKSPAVDELVVGGENLAVVGKVVAGIRGLVADPRSARVSQLMQHQRVVVRRGAALHLAELADGLALRRLVGELRRRFIELVVPLIARALMLVPPAAPLLLIAAMQLGVPWREPGLRGGTRRCDKAVVQHDAAAGVFGAHRLQNRDGVGILQVRADLVLHAVLNDRGVRAIGLHHLHALDEHISLGEFVCGVGGLLHHGSWRVGLRARGQLADGHLARARLHVAQQAEAVVRAQNVLLGEVAMEVEAVQVELLGLRYLFFGKLRRGPHAIDAPVSPRDRGINLHPPTIQPKDRIRPNAFRRKPADGANRSVRWIQLLRSAFLPRASYPHAKLIKPRSVKLPQSSVLHRQWPCLPFHLTRLHRLQQPAVCVQRLSRRRIHQLHND